MHWMNVLDINSIASSDILSNGIVETSTPNFVIHVKTD